MFKYLSFPVQNLPVVVIFFFLIGFYSEFQRIIWLRFSFSSIPLTAEYVFILHWRSLDIANIKYCEEAMRYI